MVCKLFIQLFMLLDVISNALTLKTIISEVSDRHIILNIQNLNKIVYLEVNSII